MQQIVHIFLEYQFITKWEKCIHYKSPFSMKEFVEERLYEINASSLIQFCYLNYKFE